MKSCKKAPNCVLSVTTSKTKKRSNSSFTNWENIHKQTENGVSGQDRIKDECEPFLDQYLSFVSIHLYRYMYL